MAFAVPLRTRLGGGSGAADEDFGRDKHPDDPEIKDSMNRKFHAVTEAYHYICSYAEKADEPSKDTG